MDFDAFTQGNTLEELIANAEEAMVCYIEENLKNGATLPAPSDIRQIHCKDSSFATLIHVGIYSPAASHGFTRALSVKESDGA